MAIQTINTNPFRLFGPAQDTGFGEAVGRGLEALTQHKMQQMQQQKTAQALSSLGLSPALAALDPHILQQVVHQKLQEPSQLAFAQGLQAILGGGQPQAMQQQVPAAMMQQPQQFDQQEGERLGRAIFGPPPMSEGERLGQAIFGNNPPSIPSPVPQQRAMMAPQQQHMQQSVPQIPAGLNPQQALQLAQLGLQKQALNRKEQIQQEQLAKKEASKVQAQSNKETLPYYTKVLDEDKAAQKIDLDTKRMVKLIEKGNLPNPLFYKFLKDAEEQGATKAGAAIGAAAGKSGGILGSIIGGGVGGLLGSVISPIATAVRYFQLGQSPDQEEFEKLSANFISGAKAIFGSRVTDADLRAFMQTVPQLTNTDAGKKAIIRNIQLMNEAVHLRAKAMKDIIKANKGHRPIDLALQVEEKVEPQLDKLAQEFIS